MLDDSWPYRLGDNQFSHHLWNLQRQHNSFVHSPASGLMIHHPGSGWIITRGKKKGQAEKAEFWCEHQGIPDWVLTHTHQKRLNFITKTCFFFTTILAELQKTKVMIISGEHVRQICSAEIGEFFHCSITPNNPETLCLLGREKNIIWPWLTAIAMERSTHV